MNEQTIRLELSKRSAVPGQMVTFGQGDSGGTTIVAEVYDGGVRADISGMTAVLRMRLPDGLHYANGLATISDNRITYVVDEESFCSVHGITDEAYFELASGTSVYSTSRFRVKILRASNDAPATPAQPWEDGAAALIAEVRSQVSDAVDSANGAATRANTAASAAESSTQGVQDAIDEMEQSTADSERRIQEALDAVSDISELVVPLMSPTVRGGAKLDPDGCLALRDGALGIGSLANQSSGAVRGSIVGLSAEGHAEQSGTPTTERPQAIVVVTGGEDTDGRYVELQVRDSGGTLVSTTQIPLPTRGWVAGLPDGTADTLAIDGAGHVVWTLRTDMTEQAATDGVTGTIGVDAMSTTGVIADGATVLYKSSSTTEDIGYVDLPDISGDSTVSMPELASMTVKYLPDGTIQTLARQWYERLRNELVQLDGTSF